MLIGQLQLQAPDIDPGAAAAGAAGAAVAGISMVLMLASMALVLVVVAAQWKVFSKAGQPGWASLVPIYGQVVMFQIVGRPAWWIFLLFICTPVVGIILAIDLAKSFGKDNTFAAGLILLAPIFLLILGFGSAQYQGPAVLAGDAPTGGGGAPAGDGGAPAGDAGDPPAEG